eukprot:5016197-Amphidinium_carterae.2
MGLGQLGRSSQAADEAAAAAKACGSYDSRRRHNRCCATEPQLKKGRHRVCTDPVRKLEEVLPWGL